MTSFHSSTDNQIINSELFLANVEKMCFDLSAHLAPKAEPKGYICQQVKKLWSGYNENRKNLLSNYMDKEESRLAYIASFMLPNIQKSFHILSINSASLRLPELINQPSISVLDFGSGPLSASIGLLFWIGTVKASKIKSIKIVAVDRNSEIAELGLALVRAAQMDVAIELEIVNNIEKCDARSFDLILSFNALNEFPEEKRAKVVKTLLSRLKIDGSLCLVEPGQDVHSKELGTLRDNVLEWIRSRSLSWKVVAPCTHQNSCPLSKRSVRKDWCWFRYDWVDKPAFVKNLNLWTGLRHETLNFCYFILGNKVKVVADVRVISDEIEGMKQDLNPVAKTKLFAFLSKSISPLCAFSDLRSVKLNEPHKKFLLCTPQGSLESLWLHEAFPEQFPIRGDLLPINSLKKHSQLVIIEQNRLDKNLPESSTELKKVKKKKTIFGRGGKKKP